jgi:hypothetical protein
LVRKYERPVASWRDVEAGAGELATLARRDFDFHVHKLLATFRRDGPADQRHRDHVR